MNVTPALSGAEVAALLEEMHGGEVVGVGEPSLTILPGLDGSYASPGVHDTLMAACDDYRYGLLGCTEYHDNCTDNLAAALGELGLTPPETPSPLNLFMNIPWEADGGLAFAAPVSRQGDYVLFEASLDVIVAFSACPQDILPINGEAREPTEAHFQILD